MTNLRVSHSFDFLIPMVKIKKLKKDSANSLKIKKFVLDPVSIHSLLGVVRFCFQTFSAEIRCFYNFCELVGVSTFPVRGRLVVGRISILNRTPKFGNYVDYIMKDGFFLGQPVDWHTEAISQISRSLDIAGKCRFRNPNFVDISMILRIVDREHWSSEFAQIPYLPFYPP